MHGLKVGDEVEHCQQYGWKSRDLLPKVIRRCRIVRETKTRWVLESGAQFDKATLSEKPRYLDYDRFIRPVAAEGLKP